MTATQKLPEVLSQVNIGRSKLLQLVRDGKFPKPIKHDDGGRSAVWLTEEVDAYLAARKAARDAAAA